MVIALALLSGEQNGIEEMARHLLQYIRDLGTAAVTDHTTQREKQILESLLAKLPAALVADAVTVTQTPERVGPELASTDATEMFMLQGLNREC